MVHRETVLELNYPEEYGTNWGPERSSIPPSEFPDRSPPYTVLRTSAGGPRYLRWTEFSVAIVGALTFGGLMIWNLNICLGGMGMNLICEMKTSNFRNREILSTFKSIARHKQNLFSPPHYWTLT